MAFYPNLRNAVASVLACACLGATAHAQGIPPLFGDTEVEQTVRTFATPIWVAAGLKPEDIHIVLVNSPELNSFVAGGPNIFVYTGMLSSRATTRSRLRACWRTRPAISPAPIFACGDQDMEDASYTMLLATVLGAVAAAGARDPGAIAPALGLGEDVGIRSGLHLHFQP